VIARTDHVVGIYPPPSASTMRTASNRKAVPEDDADDSQRQREPGEQPREQ